MKHFCILVLWCALLSVSPAQDALRPPDTSANSITVSHPKPASAPTSALPSKKESPSPSLQSQPVSKYQISPGDRLNFRISEDREEPRSLQVTDTGEVDIPYIGRMMATGKTCDQLAAEVKPLLEKDFYVKATVLISMDSITKVRGKIYVTGQVRIQGPLEIPSDESFTLSKAILRAGGFGDFADKRKVKLIRRKAPTSTEKSTTIVDVSEILEKGKTEKDPVLQSEDLIIVPQRLINF